MSPSRKKQRLGDSPFIPSKVISSTPKKSRRKLLHDHMYCKDNSIGGLNIVGDDDSFDIEINVSELEQTENKKQALGIGNDTEDLKSVTDEDHNKSVGFEALNSMLDQFENESQSEHNSVHGELTETHTLFTQVLENLKEKQLDVPFIQFLTLVRNERFPLDNVALRLFLDVARWYASGDSRTMRYSDTTLRFFWLGRKLFGGRFIRFMSGPKNETDFLMGKQHLSTEASKINFACPSEQVLMNINPLGLHNMNIDGPGVITPMIEMKAEKDPSDVSYVLMFDGKKIKRGADADLLGFEQGETLKQRKEKHAIELKILNETLELLKERNRDTEDIDETDPKKEDVYQHLQRCFRLFSDLLRNLRVFQISKDTALAKYKDRIKKDPALAKTLEYAMDSCRTCLYQIDNCLATVLDAQWIICKSGASLNNAQTLFANGKEINLSTQSNVKLLKSVDDMKAELKVDALETRFIKQRSPEWHEARKHVKVTGSTLYGAIGCDGLKKEVEHFDSVFSDKEKQISAVCEAAMKHGTESEIHQIATLSSVIMPFLFPNLNFHEEGFYLDRGVIVSPDGSIRDENDRKVMYAFEGKAPVERQSVSYTTRVHYEVPDRYISQTLFEGQVLNAQNGTLYLCWTPESTTVHVVPKEPKILEDALNIVNEIYNKTVPKRPTRLSKDTKTLKVNIKEHVSKCEFIGEVPSVKAVAEVEGGRPNKGIPESCTYSELIKHLLKAKASLVDSYNLQRKFASQVVVYLLADLDRLWKPEEPHAVPVMFYYRGYSLSMDIARQLTTYCRTECTKRGIDVVAISSDGEFINLMVRDEQNRPLTLYQLSKDVWSEVSAMKRRDIVNELQSLNKEYVVKKGENGNVFVETVTTGARITTPENGWNTQKSTKKVNASADAENIVEGTSTGEDNEVVRGKESEFLTSVTEGTDEADVLDDENDNTLPYDYNEIMDATENSSSEVSKLSSTQLNDILHILKESDHVKYARLSTQSLEKMLTKSSDLKRFKKADLLNICKYLNLKLLGTDKELKVKNVYKTELINQLSKLIGDNHVIQIQKRSRKSRVKLGRLQELATSVLMKQSYPKQVLNIAYATHIWPNRVQQWRKTGKVESKIEVKGTDAGFFEPYYIPEFDEKEQTFQVFTYDKTHLGTNMRKCLCLNKIEGVSIQAWKAVSLKNPEIIHPSIIDVSPEGKIADQMKEKLARTMVSEAVENKMKSFGFNKEAEFCHIIREGLYVADDKPGIPAVERCNKRLALIRWLDNNVEFGTFPPYGSRIKGMSWILYEGLRSSQEAKLYLYALAKKGTYCVRAPNTLCSESFFGSMQEMDPWGQGILSKQGVEKHINDFTTITAMKMDKSRYGYLFIHIQFKVIVLSTTNPHI